MRVLPPVFYGRSLILTCRAEIPSSRPNFCPPTMDRQENTCIRVPQAIILIWLWRTSHWFVFGYIKYRDVLQMHTIYSELIPKYGIQKTWLTLICHNNYTYYLSPGFKKIKWGYETCWNGWNISVVTPPFTCQGPPIIITLPLTPSITVRLEMLFPDRRDL